MNNKQSNKDATKTIIAVVFFAGCVLVYLIGNIIGPSSSSPAPAQTSVEGGVSDEDMDVILREFNGMQRDLGQPEVWSLDE